MHFCQSRIGMTLSLTGPSDLPPHWGSLRQRRSRRSFSAGCHRVNHLVALDVADITEVPDGLRILIRRSKGQDQAGQEL